MRRTLVRIGLAGVIGVSVRASAGEMRTDEIDSKILGRKVELHVLLPEAYDREPDRRFPAIYLLHGVGGDYTEWARVGIADEAAGLPVIIAMPEGDKSFYVNAHEDPKGRWEDYIVQEVIPHVDRRYRTIPARERRGVSGLSMGGYGALVLALRHPDLFASAASHSGALEGPRMKPPGELGGLLAKIFGPEGSAAREAYDLVRLVRRLPEGKRPHIYIDCGAQDFLLEGNRAFVAELARLGVPYEYREVPGGHTFAYWKANVRYSLTRQLEALERAKPLP